MRLRYHGDMTGGGRAPILIVDDDEDTRYVLAHILRTEGYATALAATGAAGLEYLRMHPVGVVVLDLMLPDMSGVAVRAEMRREPALATIPVVVFSALDDHGELPDVAAYVRKGSDVDVLLTAVARACRTE